MAYPKYLREKARELRRERGLTIDELAQRLALPRTTIYYWVRDLPIRRRKPSEWPESARVAGTSAMVRKYRLLREAAYEQGVAEFDELDKDPTFREFVCMYIGEGYKRSRNGVSIANSDPDVIVLATHWMRKLASRKVHFAFQHHADQDPAQLCVFWGELLGIPPEAIRFQRKSNSSQLRRRTWRSQYGVLTVRASDTYLRARLQAWIDRVKRGWRGLDSDELGV